MKGNTILIILFILGVVHVDAARTERLNLKGGLVVEGHLLSQTLGKSVTFSVERTYATVNSNWITLRAESTFAKDKLPDIWKKWIAEQKDSCKMKNLSLSKIQLARLYAMYASKSNNPYDSINAQVLSSLFGGDSHQVYVYEEGAYVRFVDLTSSEHTFKLSDIRSIEYQERSETAVNGIVDVVEVKSGEVYRGQIIEKILGEMIRIKTVDGKIRSIMSKDIDSQKKERLNPNFPLLKQAEYLDDINGTIGVIVFQKNDHDTPYVLLQDEKGHERRFNLQDVKTIGSYKNKNYVPLSDIIIKGEEVYFNRKDIPPVSCVKNKKDLFVLENDSISKMLELTIDSKDKELVVEMANSQDNKSAILFSITRIEVDKESVFAFSYEDILNKSIAPSSESVSRNNTLRKVYKVSEGFYALYMPKKGKSYYCEVK